jgi:hypothetical protein
LLEAEIVDKEKLITKLLDLLQMREVLVTQKGPDAPPAPVGMQPGQMPGQMGGPLPPTGDLDTLNSGALPEGTEPPATPTPMGGPGNPMI